jgi:acyl-CoA synthetase (AMP-forming)/AMP-acid ligase II
LSAFRTRITARRSPPSSSFVRAPQDGPAITAWSRERLSAYKIPRIVQFVDELPKGSTGKIIKREIDREPLAKIAADQAAK